MGEEFQVNVWTSSSQEEPDVGALPNGEFVVVWSSWGGFGDDVGYDSYYSVQMRRFSASANPFGNESQVNTYTTQTQSEAAISVAPDGRFLVVWQSGPTSGSTPGGGADGDRIGVSARRFDASGMAVGNEIVVNTYTTGWQGNPSVAADPTGNFLVSWSGEGEVQAQLLASSGIKIGPEFQVNTYTTGSQTSSAIASEPGGTFVVVYSSNGSPDGDSDQLSIRGQRLAAIAVIFSDGFESGDTSTWSGTTQ